MTIEITPSMWQSYINDPIVTGIGPLSFVTLRAKVAPPPGPYRHGVGLVNLPLYQAGDQLQWAMMVFNPGQALTLGIGVQSGSGDVNNLSTEFAIRSGPNVVSSEPVRVDIYKPKAAFYIKELGSSLYVFRMTLASPSQGAASFLIPAGLSPVQIAPPGGTVLAGPVPSLPSVNAAGEPVIAIR